MRINVLLVLVLFACQFSQVMGQEGGLGPKMDLGRPVSISSPSANVASLMKFVEVPISYYSGTPQIFLPIHEIKSTNTNASIRLNYNASGIKVEEDATSVGLGWSLIAGGSIARAMAGKPDEAPWGYRSSAGAYALPKYTDAFPESWLSTLSSCIKETLSSGKTDLLPDTYYLNFNGYSAKMYFDKDGAPLISPYKAWKVQGDEKTGFVITVEDGTIYEFKALENTRHSVSSSVDDGSVVTGPSAWFLTKILSSNLTDSIKFQYTPVTYSQRNKNDDETYIDLIPGQNPFACSGVPVFTDKVSYISTQMINTHILSSIESNLERVDFIGQNGRFDIESRYGGLDYRLNEIKVYKKAGNQLIKNYQLDYSYFGNPNNSDPVSKRLMLMGLRQIAAGGSLDHKFAYLNPEQMPARDSKAQDHWGYYNGVSNSTLIPFFQDGSLYGKPGADREAKPNLPGTGLLSQIKYPTGGTVDFTYENNDYSFLRGAPIDKTGLDSVLVEVSATASTNKLTTNQGTVTQSFYLPPNTGPARVVCLVKGKIFGDALADVSISGGLGPGTGSGDTRGKEYSLGDFYADPKLGSTYTLSAHRDAKTELAWITAHYKVWKKVVKPPVYSRLAGGVRIKSIVESGNPDPTKNGIREFQYKLNDTTSSGNIINLPVYENTSYWPIYCPSGGQAGINIKVGDLIYQNRHSVSMVALGRTQGNTVGYSKVTVLLGKNGENGKEEYFYEDEPSDIGGGGHPYIPFTSFDDLRGMLKAKVTYLANGQELQRTEHKYKLNNKTGDPNLKWMYGAKFGLNRQNNTRGANGCPDSWSFRGGMYRIYQFWPVLESTIESTVDVNSGIRIANVVKYNYDPINLAASREVKLKSDGDSTVTVTRFPHNYPSEQVYSTLVSRNVIDKPVEKIIYNNATQILREKLNYDFWSNGVISPKTAEIQLKDHSTEERFRFYDYDKYENILSQSKTKGQQISYIWGFSGKYLMAEIKGSDNNAVRSLVNQALLDNPSATEAQMRSELNSLRSKLPGAEVITYTYNPLIGLASITDAKGMTTSYDYDAFGRLQHVKDQYGNVIKRYDYYYKP